MENYETRVVWKKARGGISSLFPLNSFVHPIIWKMFLRVHKVPGTLDKWVWNSPLKELLVQRRTVISSQVLQILDQNFHGDKHHVLCGEAALGIVQKEQ